MGMDAVRSSIRWMSAVVIGSMMFSSSFAADPKKQERCSKYAQRAVEQYQLMQSHPQCHVPDDLNWHGNLEGHYNGCMLIPEVMARAGEAGRDNHLLACSGMSAASNGAAASASTPPQSTAAPTAMNTQADSPPNTAASTGSAAPAPATAIASNVWVKPLIAKGPPFNMPLCKHPPAAPLLDIHPDGYGVSTKILGVVLSYTDTQTRQIPDYMVARPYFLAVEIGCKNLAGDTGLWMWANPGRAQGYLFDVSVDGTVTRSPLNAAQIAQLTPPG